MSFAPVPLPACPPGGPTDEILRSDIATWVRSDPLRALVDASGWAWPTSDDLGEQLAVLGSLSNGWDYRNGRPRNEVSTDPAVVGDRVVPEDLAIDAAKALGLVDAAPPVGPFGRIVVLGGLVNACANRIRHAAQLAADRPGVEVVLLTAPRPLTEAESGTDAVKLGYNGGDGATEATIVLEVVDETWAAEAADDVEGADDWWIRRWAATDRRPAITVVSAPTPASMRWADTGAQLAFWAGRTQPVSGVAIVTTQIYGPYQHLDAIRTIGRPYGASVVGASVDAASASIPLKAFTARPYLQEVRSTILAAGLLVAELNGAP